ncbi:DUF3093 domain-containing protein [Actinotalea sp. K2]|uniref:DUF3093 domain-containing protein n=1 Tax=Actinotalea sp. K2 TaxID=2939438 RepID=UPI0020175516|nr:DUF3093 domain-containing protein [Actinotalea sp. K2]MCL3862197.1 DUF3093 domain-containing protein [Actinotalea sp. K2]
MTDSSAAPTSPGSTVRAYRERLWPGPLGWSFVVGFALLVLIALLPVDRLVALVVSAAAFAGAVVVAVVWSPVVAVEAGELRAGAAHIPVRVLGAADVLDKDGLRAALGPGSDARAYVCLRAWIPGAVEVRVDDPLDPTPSWIVSTRHPERLLAAIGVPSSGQAAHSEQIG